jgi:hypothetical protein
LRQLLTERYRERLAGLLSCYDRIIVTGTLPGACYAKGMTGFLSARQIRIFDYPRFAEPLRDRVRERAAELTVALRGRLSPLELAHCFGRTWVALRRRSNSTSEQHRSNPGDRYQRCRGSSGQKAVRPALHVTQDIGPLDHWISFLNFSARAAGQAAPIRASSEYGRRELRNDFRISESGYV